jgi:Na+/H+ antiporter
MSAAATHTVWFVIAICALAVPLVALARRLTIAYPIVLLLAGLVLGFAPFMPRITLDPALVLVIFLPPLLYWEALTAPTDVMRDNAVWIASLAIGLVIVTTGIVGIVAHAAIPGLIWPMAFVLGAIVAPTDELAAAPVLERLRVPRRLVAIIEGESLINDAGSLILYASCIAAVVSGTVNVPREFATFVLAAVGGTVVGLVCAWAAVRAWRRIRDSDLQGLIAFILPFLSYTTATSLGLSGVLAVVAAGIVASRHTPFILTPAARLRGTGFYDSVVFLVNALLFTIVGLQLHALAAVVFSEYRWTDIAWYAVAINAAVILTRFAWFMVLEYAPFLSVPGAANQPSFRRALIGSWSGLRGAVSLAAALAVPLSTATGAPIAHRDLIIFLTFTVILVTLVGGGLSLPLVASGVVAPDTDDENSETTLALRTLSDAAADELQTLQLSGHVTASEALTLSALYTSVEDTPGGSESRVSRRNALAERAIIHAQRTALRRLRKDGTIDNVVLRRINRSLDAAEVALPTQRSSQ